MKTSSFETLFIEALRDHVETRHAGLQLTLPSTGTYVTEATTSFTPDAVVKNRRTGEVLIVEVKGGGASNTVPYAFFSKLKAMKNRMLDKPVSMVLVSNTVVPSNMQELLKEEDITLAHAGTVQDAIRAIDGALAKLERR